MTHNLRIRLIGLIVRDNIQRETRFRYAVIDDALLNIALYALARIRGGQCRG
ncbi:hypothetical protein D3C87_2185630 [compost metagenome]